MLLRRDLVQGTDREAALRQMIIEVRKAEGQGARCADALLARQQTAQLRDDRGAIPGPVIGDGRGGHERSPDMDSDLNL